MGDVGKRLFPTFASGGTGFEFVSFPLVQAFHWDGTDLLKLGDRKQLATEPEQNSGNQYTAPFSGERRFPFFATVAKSVP